ERFQLSKLGSFDAPNDIGGTQEEINVFTLWQWGVGLDYRIPGVEWDLALSWQQGESKRNSQGIERIRFDRMFLGMDAVREPGTGAIVCRVQLFDPTPAELAASVAGLKSSVPISPFFDPSASSVQAGALAEDPNVNSQPLPGPVGLDGAIEDCVPYNIMGSGNVTPEAIDYIGTPKLGRGFVDQDFAEALLTGDLYDGWGYGPVSFAAGVTWRDQQFIEWADPVSVDMLGPPVNVPELGIEGFPPGVAGGSPNL